MGKSKLNKFKSLDQAAEPLNRVHTDTFSSELHSIEGHGYAEMYPTLGHSDAKPGYI
jgi:hypothetical protein